MFNTFRANRQGAPHKKLVVGLTAVLTLSMAACGGGSSDGDSASSLDELKSGTVRMGVADLMPTTGAEEKPTGLAPELAAMVLNELGMENIEVVQMDFGALIPSLQSGRIDVAAGGFYVTPERCNAIEMANPSYYFLDGMAVPQGNPDNIKTYADIAEADAKLGAITGSATMQLAVADGVPEANVSEYPDVPTMLDALKAGRGCPEFRGTSVAAR